MLAILSGELRHADIINRHDNVVWSFRDWVRAILDLNWHEGPLLAWIDAYCVCGTTATVNSVLDHRVVLGHGWEMWVAWRDNSYRVPIVNFRIDQLGGLLGIQWLIVVSNVDIWLLCKSLRHVTGALLSDKLDLARGHRELITPVIRMNLLTVDGKHRELATVFGGRVNGGVLCGLVAVEAHVTYPASHLASHNVCPVLLHTQIVLYRWH